MIPQLRSFELSRALLPGLDFDVPYLEDGSVAWPEPNPASKFWITGPALISFSGGRTSAFMLFQILWAHGGTLPDHVFVCFANTGKEREETLRFVHECAIRWRVEIHWLEWQSRPIGKAGRNTPPSKRYEEVGLNSASRNGEPFRALIKRKKYLPNAVKRFCTAELKIDAMKQFMLARRYRAWTNVVGLRADEMKRIAKSQRRNDEGRERWKSVWPLHKAKIRAEHVWAFWLGDNVDPKALAYPLPQGFDLGLYPYEGNCDGCFLKGREILTYQERERPGYLDWWIESERRATELGAKADGARFVTEFSYADLKRDVDRSPLLIPVDWRKLEFDSECGVSGTDRRIRCGSRRAA